MNNFGILVLAAGQSSRFGSDKLLAHMPDGRPVIAHSLAPLLAISREEKIKLCVITRPDNISLIHYLTLENIPYSLCPDAHQGMGHSIAHGIKTHQTWDGWVIALADMPKVSQALVTELIQNINQHKHVIVRPHVISENKKIPAHPVYFPRHLGYQLSQLQGDRGAKELIKLHSQSLKSLDILEGDNLIDVDTPEILKSF